MKKKNLKKGKREENCIILCEKYSWMKNEKKMAFKMK